MSEELQMIIVEKRPRALLCEEVNKKGILKENIQQIIIDGDNILVFYWGEKK